MEARSDECVEYLGDTGVAMKNAASLGTSFSAESVIIQDVNLTCSMDMLTSQLDRRRMASTLTGCLTPILSRKIFLIGASRGSSKVSWGRHDAGVRPDS